MGDTVFANGMSIACKASSGKTTAAMPDVCMSPPSPPAGPLPIPYPNTASASDTDKGSKTVKIGGEPVMLKDKSVFKTSNGNEAATKSFGMSVVTHKIQGEASFVAWSMDVKFEDENVPRHMDLMGHNESCQPTATPPWPFMSSADLGKKGNACKKSGDAKKVNDACSGPPADDSSGSCCKARKCVMVPYAPNKCCKDAAGTQKTPHHPVPMQDHYQIGARLLPKVVRQLMRLTGLGSYDGDKAPCICVDGESHALPMEHGRCGRAFALLRNSLPGKTYKYTDVNVKTAAIVQAVTGCDKDCIQAQMDNYHQKDAKATGNLRKSRQAARGGESTLKRALSFVKKATKFSRG
jgi:Domain of unknown function (DUF4150)/GHH signature containing HNH/Endo VII superfamily nuclease toxin  2